METKKGKFIVLYGINNLGKTTQIENLRNFLHHEWDKKVCVIKYPIYELVPTGPLINSYLREKNPFELSPREVQILYAMNRTHFASTLEELLQQYDVVLSEDYAGTSFGWGMAAGVDKEFLYQINSHLRVPDLSILLDGERFIKGIEKGHKHENAQQLIGRARQAHLEVGKELGWHTVNANQDEVSVARDINCFIKSLLRQA